MTDNELIFIDYDAPLVNGKAASVSYVRKLRELRADALMEPIKIGSTMAQFVKSELNANPGKAFAWLPDYRIYAASRSEEKLKAALAATTFQCSGNQANGAMFPSPN